MTLREGYRWTPRRWSPSLRLREVLDALVEGRSNAEIGEMLGITSGGVKWHISQALLETGASDRRELADWWQEARAQDALAPAGSVIQAAARSDIMWISDVRLI